MSNFVVTKKATRPAGPQDRCFYCGQVIGETHRDICVLVEKMVVIRMIVEYEIDVPAHWSKKQIEFHRNHGTWCADNALVELENLASEKGCLCGEARFEYVRDASGSFLKE